MVTYETWTARFPQFLQIEESLFDLFLGDSQIEMGVDETRWADTYDVAQANLISHYVAAYKSYQTGDDTPLQPIRTKEVDDVMVEFAVSRDLRDNFDPLNSTIYGQAYIKWRRQAFAGARVLGVV